MITSIVACIIGTACITDEPVQFKHTFIKDEVASYELRVSGEFENEGDIKIEVDIDVTTKEVVKDGASYSIKINKVLAQMLGTDMPIENVSPILIDVKSNGTPKLIDLKGGSLAIVYIAMLSRMLPDKDLEIAQTFSFAEKAEEFEFTGTGLYLEDRIINEKSHAVLQTKGILTPKDDEPGSIKVTLLLNKATGQIFTTEAKIELPNGELNMKMSKKA